MTPTVHLLVFDGFADWEPAHATAELNRSGRFRVSAVGFTRDPVTSMGGLSVTPDGTLDDVGPERTALFLLPGGDLWEAGPRPELHPLLHRLLDAGVPVAAICGATLEVARAGLHRGPRHTSNALDYLKARVPGYDGDADYVHELAVHDRGLVTASGLGAVELAREIFAVLEVYDEETRAAWYTVFKHGIVPAEMA